MLDINFTFFIQFLNFVVLMFILNVLLFKPVIAFMARRKAMIDQTLEEGRTAETAADETLKRYHDILAGARSAADARFAEVQVAIEEGHRGHLAEAERRADEVTTAATVSIRETGENVREDLRGQAQALAEAIAQKVLGRSV
ncbi:MAG: ATP synthase F0 subunit B [bacterium]|jgi:F-type H+-transporting ATPase subunit b|nr:ATP synthase F0 subunit B [bacterium]MCZ6700489.1 ATP synthase F0 subunit B [bacterium]